MTGNPQLGVLSGRLTYLDGGSGAMTSPQGPKEADSGSICSISSSSIQGTGHRSGADAGGVWNLPESRSKLLCILSVPAHMIPTDMLQFTAPFKEQVHSVRILRPCNPVGPSDPVRMPAEYMVLLQMESQVSSSREAEINRQTRDRQ